VVGEDRGEQLLVGEDGVEILFGDGRERVVGRGEDRERAFTVEGVDQSGPLLLRSPVSTTPGCSRRLREFESHRDTCQACAADLAVHQSVTAGSRRMSRPNHKSGTVSLTRSRAWSAHRCRTTVGKSPGA
jgi:hypothetical protein